MSSSTQNGANGGINGVSAQQTKYLDALRRDGFVVIRNLIAPEQLEQLRNACGHITSLARNNGWPHVRTVPKQYPPWPTNSEGTNIWGVQHLLHPDMPNRKVFAELYFSDSVLRIVEELVGLHDSPSTSISTTATNPQQQNGNYATATRNHNDHHDRNETDTGTGDSDNRNDNLVMELFNLLVSPSSTTDFELCWHRDDIKPTATPEEEQLQLAEKSPQTGAQLHAQYNIALYEEASLIVIPGSHRRIRTARERNATPYEAHLPQQVNVHLNAGDAVFYDSNILHRGVYCGIDSGLETGRMTLHGSVGLAGHGNERARQVLQHAVGQWVHLDQEVGFGLEGMIGRRAEAMRNRLVAMGQGEHVGYSLEG